MSLKKDMAKEIKKYRDFIYYYDAVNKCIEKATWCTSLNDYNHFFAEAHHVVPYTDWELNTKNVRDYVGHNVLIILPKEMHQHLENPLHKLPKKVFEKLYGINPDSILFDVNSRQERTCQLFYSNLNTHGVVSQNTTPTLSLLSEEDLCCFAECNLNNELENYKKLYEGCSNV